MTDTIKLSPVDMSDISDIWVTGLPPLQLTSSAFKPQYPMLGLSSVLLLTTLKLPCLDCQTNKTIANGGCVSFQSGRSILPCLPTAGPPYFSNYNRHPSSDSSPDHIMFLPPLQKRAYDSRLRTTWANMLIRLMILPHHLFVVEQTKQFFSHLPRHISP